MYVNVFYVISSVSWDKCFPIHCACICINVGENEDFPFFGSSDHSVKKEKKVLFWVIVCILNFIAVPLNFHLC